MSLRQAIDDKCRDCTYDNLAGGTWRQQTTLCSVTACPLWPYRPQTKAEIPQSVLRYYGIEMGDFQDKEADLAPTTPESRLPHEGAKSPDSQATESEIKEVSGCG